MALMDFIKKQFINVIQWTEDDETTLAWRFPMAGMEIQNGGSLTVRDSQAALFVNEGTAADAFGAGMYKLTTQTLPVLTYLKNWDKLFESPFKSDVYFYSTRLKIDRKWGTPNPVTVRDKDFGMVRLRAFGIYSYRIADPKLFYQQISGSRERYTSDELEGQLRNTIITAISDVFGESGVPFIDMAANQHEFGKALNEQLTPTFSKLGLALDTLMVQNISLPEELQKMLDARIGVNIMGGMQGFTQYQAATAIPLAAQNEGGLAGLGAGVGVGLGMGQMMGNVVGQALTPGAATVSPAPTLGPGAPVAHPAAPAAPAATPAAPAAAAAVSADDIVAAIEKLHGLVGKGILSQAEFDAKKAELLSKLG